MMDMHKTENVELSVLSLIMSKPLKGVEDTLWLPP